MNEIDLDKSGTVDFFEFLSVARLVTQQKGRYCSILLYTHVGSVMFAR